MNEIKTKKYNEEQGEEGSRVRINFEVRENLRNAFKGKIAQQGKKVKDVLTAFMVDYVKDENDS